MKNRVLLAMLIIFIVLSSIWITCGTIFVVREIEVIDTSELLTQEEKNQIAKDSGLYGKNILFNINEEKIAQGIKSSNPTIKLQSVKAEFPSRVVLKVARSLPVYYDSKNEIYLDADMCVVEEQPNCIDIANANLNLVGESLKLGDVVLGKDAKTQCKIKQLKIVANYFSTLSDKNQPMIRRNSCNPGEFPRFLPPHRGMRRQFSLPERQQRGSPCRNAPRQ